MFIGVGPVQHANASYTWRCGDANDSVSEPVLLGLSEDFSFEQAY